MVYLILSLVALGLFCAFLGYRSHKRGESEEIVVGEGDCTRCTPDNVMCEQEFITKKKRLSLQKCWRHYGLRK